MPRDSNGFYVLPESNPVADGQIIEASWANNTLSDVAVQLNNVYTRDGLLGPVNPLLVPNGSTVAPGLAFVTQPNLGLYRDALNVLGISAGGVVPIKFSNISTEALLPIGIADGSVTAPSLRFSSDTDTGMYFAAAGKLGITVDGKFAASFSDGTINTGVIGATGSISTEFVFVTNQKDSVVWSGVIGQVNDKQRWMLRFADETREGANNVGSDFTILRADNAGIILTPNPLSINRATGKTTLQAVDVVGALLVKGGVEFSATSGATPPTPPVSFLNGISAVGEAYFEKLSVGAAGAAVAAGFLYKSAENIFTIRAGNFNQATFGYHSFGQFGFTSTGDITAGGRSIITGAGSAGATPGLQAVNISGPNGGGIIMNDGTSWNTFHTLTGNLRITCAQAGVGTSVFQMNSNGDFIGKLLYGYTDATHYVRSGWNGNNAAVEFQHNAGISQLYLDPSSNFAFSLGGSLSGFFAPGPNKAFYHVNGTKTWELKPMAGGYTATNASSQIVVTFPQAFSNPCMVCTAEAGGGQKYFVTIIARSASGFTARVVDDGGGDSGPGCWVNWIAYERNV